PVCLFSRYDLKDTAKFEKALSSVPMDIWKKAEESRVIGEFSEERAQAREEKFPLRDLKDPRQLATNLVEMVTSKVLSLEEGQLGPKKLVLAFDKNIGNESALNLVREIKDLKKDPNYRVLLQNLEVVIGATDELPGELDRYAGKDDAMVFIFALDDAREKLAGLEKHDNVFAGYMKMKEEFKEFHYFPLIEVVTMTLARYLNRRTNCLDKFSDEELEQINIATRPEEERNVLIFELIPRAERVKPGEIHDRYALLRQFIEAA
ncbi:MAG: hypothetical protein WBB84_00915, partial [Candidatus Omnitrophota bacterium]